VDVLAAAVGAQERVGAGAHLAAAVVTVPDRDAVPPPQLAGDAPVFDVLQPVEIDLLEAFGDDADAPVAHGLQGGFGERFDADEPLLRDHRLDDFAAALGTRHVEGVWLFLDDQTGGAHILPQFFAALEAVETRIRPADLGHSGLPVEHREDGQAVALTDFVVVRVVAGGDFEGAGAELAIHIVIGDDGNLAAQNWHTHFAANVFLVARVVGMDGDGGIAQDGLGAGGGDGDVFALTLTPAPLSPRERGWG
jgi:hypothetical protein